MHPTLPALEQQRHVLIDSLSALGDFRPGSITGIIRRCGKPTCHCAQPDDPGHGPNLRLTYKSEGKTVSESLPSALALRKAEREIAEFRRFQQLSKELVAVNEQICRLRPVEESLTPEEKKRQKSSARRSRAK